MRDHDDVNGVGTQAVNDAVALINHFPDVDVVGFGHGATAVRELWQMAGGVQQAFHKGVDIWGQCLTDPHIISI